MIASLPYHQILLMTSLITSLAVQKILLFTLNTNGVSHAVHNDANCITVGYAFVLLYCGLLACWDVLYNYYVLYIDRKPQ